jgi:hypothetical protein
MKLKYLWILKYLQDDVFLTVSYYLKRGTLKASLYRFNVFFHFLIMGGTGSHKHHKWIGPAIRMSLPSFRLGNKPDSLRGISKETAKSLNMYKCK